MSVNMCLKMVYLHWLIRLEGPIFYIISKEAYDTTKKIGNERGKPLEVVKMLNLPALSLSIKIPGKIDTPLPVPDV